VNIEISPILDSLNKGVSSGGSGRLDLKSQGSDIEIDIGGVSF